MILSMHLYIQNYFSSFQRVSWDLHVSKQDCNLALYLKPEINKMYRLILGLNCDFMITVAFLSSSIHHLKCNQPCAARGEKLALLLECCCLFLQQLSITLFSSEELGRQTAPITKERKKNFKASYFKEKRQRGESRDRLLTNMKEGNYA